MFFRIPKRSSRPAEYSAPDHAETAPASTAPASRYLFTFLRNTGVLQTVARGTLAVWLAPTVFAVLAAFLLAGKPIPLQAQNAGQTVIVLDFAVQQGMEAILGRKAADALAVELQSAGGYEVVSRQQIEQAIANNPGMRAPFDGSTQVRLAQIVGARSIFSGRVMRTEVVARKSASATIEMRQLDVGTGDYINGVVVTEVTTDKLGQVDNEVLLDEALNKAVFTAWRTMRSARPIEGTVLNVTLNDTETNIGTRDGVALDQRYAVLRDVFDKARNVTERIKVAEVKITKVEADASIATVIAGTSARTNDRLRQIFVPSAYPVTPANSGSFPILPKPQRTGTPSVVKKTGSTLYGLLALAGLVGLAGFAGGSSGLRADLTAPSNVQPVSVANADGGAAIDVSWNPGIPGVLRSSAIVGFLVYRGESQNFNPSPANLQEFVKGANNTRFSDNGDRTVLRTVNIELDEGTGGGTGGGTGNEGSSCADVGSSFSVEDTTEDADTDATTTGNTLTINTDSLEAEFSQSPPIPGRRYFYKVTRLTVLCKEDENTDGGTGGGTGGGGGTTATLSLAESNVSPTGGAATALPRPQIIGTNQNLDALSIQIEGQVLLPPQPGPTPSATGTPVPVFLDAFSGADEFIVQVSVTSAFNNPSNYYQERIENPSLGGEAILNILIDHPFVIPNFEVGETTRVYVRVGARNTNDSPGSTVFSQPFAINNPTSSSLTSRFLPSGSGARSSRGLGLPGAPGGGLLRGGNGRKPGSIARPALRRR